MNISPLPIHPPLCDFPQPQVLPHDPGHWLRNTLVHGLGFNPSVPVEHDVARLEFKTMALRAAMRFPRYQYLHPPPHRTREPQPANQVLA